MTKHFIKISIIAALVLFACCGSVFADGFGYEFTENQLKIKNTSVCKADKYVTFEATARDKANPFYYVDQFSSGEYGWWAKTIDMSDAAEGLYDLTIGGTAYNGSSSLKFFYTPGNRETKSIISGPVDLSQKDKYIVEGSDGVITREFAVPQSSGIVLASFDARVDGDTSTLNLWVGNKNGTNPWTATADTKFAVLNFSSDGKFGMYSERNDYSSASGSTAYEHGRKYHADLWFDLDSGRVVCYLDNEYFKTVPLNEKLGRICNIFFHSSGASAENKTVIENFIAKSVKYGDNDLPAATPEYVRNEINLFVDGEKDGNIFDGKDAIFNIHAVNRTEAKKSCTAKVNISNSETNETVYADTLEFTLDAAEHKIIPFCADMRRSAERFGLFEISVVVNEGGKEKANAHAGFSSVNAPSELNGKSGVSTLFVHGYYDPDILTDILAGGGFGVIRDTINYNRWLDNGKSLSAEYNRWQNHAESKSISQIIMLDGKIGTSYSSGVPYTDEDREKFAGFAESVAHDLNGKAEYFELYNELNWELRDDPDTYARLIVCAKDALQKGSPGAKLCAFASARTGASQRSWTEKVLQKVQALAAERGKKVKDYIDVVSVHPYKIANRMAENEGASTAEDIKRKTTDTEGTLTYQVLELRNLLNKYGLESTPIIATELGWSSTAKLMDGQNGNAAPVSAKQQAEFTVRAAMLLQNELEQICWFTATDNPGNSNELEKNFGLLNDWRGTIDKYHAKPVYAALANYNALVSNSERVSTYEQMLCDYKKNGVYRAKFSNGITSLWTTDGKSGYTYNTDAKSVKVYDIYGNESLHEVSDGALSLEVSTSPIYVRDMSKLSEISFEIGEGGIRTKLVSAGGINEAAMLVIASFHRGNLCIVNLKNINAGFVGSEYTDYIPNEGHIKAFLWSRSSLTPLAEPIEFNQR